CCPTTLEIWSTIAAVVSVPYYMTQNARSVSYAQVVEHLKHLERLDHHIKTGRVDKKTGLELFILSV
ncbi:MAG: hypothetical protein EA374_08580, partial [Acholeplasmatales bacterium]